MFPLCFLAFSSVLSHPDRVARGGAAHLGMSSLARRVASSGRFPLLGVPLLGLQPSVLSTGAAGEVFGEVPAVTTSLSPRLCSPPAARALSLLPGQWHWWHTPGFWLQEHGGGWRLLLAGTACCALDKSRVPCSAERGSKGSWSWQHCRAGAGHGPCPCQLLRSFHRQASTSLCSAGDAFSLRQNLCLKERTRERKIRGRRCHWQSRVPRTPSEVGSLWV